MKKIVMILALVLTLATALTPAPAKAQTTVPQDSVDEVEVFSDTTSVDSTAIADPWDEFDNEWDEWEQADAQAIMSGLNDGGLLGGLAGGFIGFVIVICVLFFMFVLAPILIIGLIIYFVYKNRRDRMRVMEAAIKSGRQIPMDAFGKPYQKNDDIWDKGIKQMFLGAGLALLLWVIIGKLGLAIGALVLLIGCGNVVISYNAKQKQKEKEINERIFNKPSDKAE